MHELSVCEALIRQIERICAEHEQEVVKSITLSVGPLSGVEPKLLRHAYPLAAAGTVAEHARLDINTGPVVVRCTVCEAETPVAPNRLLCGACGDFRTRLIAGDELLLERLELDQQAVSA